MKNYGIIVMLFLTTTGMFAQADKPADPVRKMNATVNVFQPKSVPATDARVASLKVPAGFRIQKFAEKAGEPRMMVVRPDGTVYVSRRSGDILMLKDTNNDGKADTQQVVLTKKQVHGLAIRGEELYFITVTDIFKAKFNPDGTLGTPDSLVGNLPDGGQHPNRTLAFGPDGNLYVSIGSTCNECTETRDENATLVVMKPDGTGQRIFAKGLRNTIGFDWHPTSKELYGMDHGIDWYGDDEQREELNLLKDGGHYGWPYIYGEGKINPQDEPDEPIETFKKKATNPLLTYTAHSAPLDFMFYTGQQFPAEYRNDAIVTFRGSWNRAKPSGYKVALVEFDAAGKPTRFTDFITGWLVDNNDSHFGRLVGLAQNPDGSLLISDDTNGVIYKVSYGK